MYNSSMSSGEDVRRSIFLAEPSLKLAASHHQFTSQDHSPTTAELSICINEDDCFPPKHTPALGRTSSSSCSTSFGSPLLSAASTSDHSSTATPNVSEWSATCRHISPYSLPSFQLSEQLGTFIVYLEPSPDSYYAQSLSITRNYIVYALGLDPSFAYPIHCSLSSFFTLSTPYKLDPQVAKLRAVEAIAKSVYDVLDSWTKSRADTGSAPHTTTLESVSKAEGDLRGKRLNEPLFHIGAVELQNRQEPSQEEINEKLCSVRVTPDGGIIVPWDLSWLTQECQNDNCSSPKKSRLAELCSSMEAHLQAEFDSLHISGFSNPKAATGIRPKPARHTTLLNRKECPLPLGPGLLEVAQEFDRVATHSAGSEVLWDLVVYELQSWSDFDTFELQTWSVFDTGETEESKYAPHDLQEVVRISDIARLQ